MKLKAGRVGHTVLALVAPGFLKAATPPVLQAGRFLSLVYRRSWGTRSLDWYDHVYDHLAGPENWVWLERGILASDQIRSGDLVLDLCCGEGTDAGIFFAPKAGVVDGVDRSVEAIRLARKRWMRPNVAFHVADVLADPFPRATYNVVVLNAALEYFSMEDGHRLLDKIASALSSSRGILFGGTPVWTEPAPDNHGQVTYLDGPGALEAFLSAHFGHVELRRSREMDRSLYFFTCR